MRIISRAGTIRCDHRANCIHRVVEPPRRFTVTRFEFSRPRPRSVKLRRKARPVDAEGMNLLGERAAVVLATQFHDGIERIKRPHEAFDRLTDRARIVHGVLCPAVRPYAQSSPPYRRLWRCPTLRGLAGGRQRDPRPLRECKVWMTDGREVLVLTWQTVPPLRSGMTSDNRCANGAYELLPAAAGTAAVSLFATGSEVAVAVQARTLLAERGIDARVVAVPCFELLQKADAVERQTIIGAAPVRIGIEAAIRRSWDAVIGSGGAFVGMTGFGASAPAKDLYRHFGITAERVVDQAVDRLSRS
jgi:hypothetical protein